MTFNRMQGFSSIENKQRQKKNEIMLWLHNQTSRLSGPFKNEHLLHTTQKTNKDKKNGFLEH